MNTTIRTRFAPSPTGTPESVHLGFVIRALWSYAYAKNNGGQFILRIEDTDKKRSRKDTELAIYEILKEFGISWDEGPDVGGPYGPYRQSERISKYQEAAKLLVQKGYAYYDFDSVIREKEQIKQSYATLGSLKSRPDARNIDPIEAQNRVDAGEPYVVRVKIPDEKIFEYEDWILKKKVRFVGKEISDLIILKSDGYPTYHLAVVVDDIDMKITHVFRGQEWISSTPVHLYLYEGMASPIPQIGHFTVILDPRTKKKFSKRDLTAMFGVRNWVDQGYLHEALLNYLMLLGWAPKDNREIFSLDEFVAAMDQSGIQKSNPVFDQKKLDWFNGYYLRQKTNDELVSLFRPFLKPESNASLLASIVPLIKDRIVKLSDINTFAGFFFSIPMVDTTLFGADAKTHLKIAIETISSIDKFETPVLNESLMTAVKNNSFKTGDFFMTMRIALTGSKFTPPINESMVILGKSEVIKRLNMVYESI